MFAANLFVADLPYRAPIFCRRILMYYYVKCRNFGNYLSILYMLQKGRCFKRHRPFFYSKTEKTLTMQHYFDNFWKTSGGVHQAFSLSSAPLSKLNRTLAFSLVKSDNKKLAIAVYALSDMLNLQQLSLTMQAQRVSVVPDKFFNHFFKYSTHTIHLLTHLRNLPVLIDTRIILFPSVLVSIGKQGIDMDPFQFIRLIKGQLFRITHSSCSNKSNIL